MCAVTSTTQTLQASSALVYFGIFTSASTRKKAQARSAAAAAKQSSIDAKAAAKAASSAAKKQASDAVGAVAQSTKNLLSELPGKGPS